MTITWKEILLSVIIVVVAFGLGVWLGYSREEKKLQEKIELIEKAREKDQNYIDSLKSQMGEIDSVIVEIKTKEIRIDTIREKSVERLRTLPLDSSLRLLQNNLKEYEHFIPSSL